jgi:hypothetical protein
MAATYREVELTLQDPTVNIEASEYGHVKAVLHAHRVNNRGVTEAYRINLTGVDVWELACVARSATQALRVKAAADIASIQGRLDYAEQAWDA